MGSLLCAWNWSQPWSQICTEKEKIWLILRKKSLVCRSGHQFGQCSSVLCEKPMNFYLLSVWVMIKNGCNSSWLNQELLAWRPLTSAGASEALLSVPLKGLCERWGKKLGLRLGSLQKDTEGVSLLVLHGPSARGTPVPTAGHGSLGKHNDSDFCSSSMSQAVPHKLHISRRAGENCLAFLFRNGQRSGESTVGELAATGDQVRNCCVLWTACLVINEMSSWSRSWPELLLHREELIYLTASLEYLFFLQL